ncbi:MAG: LPS-assembly protein LptD, partial [Sphingomicrobium sp.]
MTALPLFLAYPDGARAQQAPAAAEPMVDFSANEVIYDSQAEVITASGQVRMSRDGNYLAANEVSWDRKTGRVVAEGDVVVVNPEGDKLIGDRVDLTDSLRDGTIENLLIVLEGGGRIAAVRGSRNGDRTELVNAVYSPCPVTTPAGCPKDPSWKITAASVSRDAVTGRIRFAGGRLSILGFNIP